MTAGHSIFDVEIEKDIECKEHAEEVVRFYCEPCETCICVLCTFNEHKVSAACLQFALLVSVFRFSNGGKKEFTCLNSLLNIFIPQNTQRLRRGILASELHK